MDELYEKYKLTKNAERIKAKQEKLKALRLEINTAWIDYRDVANRSDKNRAWLREARELLVKQLIETGSGPPPNIEESLAAVTRLGEAQLTMDRAERDFARKCDAIVKHLKSLLPKTSYCPRCGIELSSRELSTCALCVGR